MTWLLERADAARCARKRADAVDSATIAAAAGIVDDVRTRGDAALRAHAERLGDLSPGRSMVISRAECERAALSISASDRALIEQTADQIRRFALAQRGCLTELDAPVPGGRAGHWIRPVVRAGCYAPGGRYPLPSSVLMTAVTARAAGVEEVIVASPKPGAITLAAAFIAGADSVLAVGGAQAVAALAYGTESVRACDVIVGPGNRWVTAAKKLVSGNVGIDMLAGPSELVVLADGAGDAGEAALIAADLLAQAEHDDDAVPTMVTTSTTLADEVERELEIQLRTLPTAGTARRALRNGRCLIATSLDEAIEAVSRLAPEHLEIMTREPAAVARRIDHFGAVFLGRGSAEILGDYGVGPNHVLPTGGTARFTGGLSVLNFLRVRTWLEMEDSESSRAAARNAARLARLEGLEAHARAADLRSH